MSQTTTPTVAEIIRQQIGGLALRMLGANNLIDHGDALSFRIKGSRKANYIKITLTPMDDYTVEFKKIGRAPNFKITDVSTHEMIYVDMLHDLIESVTGLYTRF